MLDKKYDHNQVEKNKYNNWCEKEYFKSGDLSKEPFCIVIPPPNVTGNLHLGHAWDTAIQDIIIRYKRMNNYDALWLPGMDHAGIATQAKVDKKLQNMGYIPRQMDRQEWLNHAWSWKNEYADNIHRQWAKLGLSLDYSKERFTLDEGLNKAVNTVFVKLYQQGLIYRGYRIINWDPQAQTALSNEEVIYKDIEGAFYHLKYYLEDSEEYLEVATTRPETLFGDTAVAVNPDDKRYQQYIGKNVILPIVGKKIPVIADEHANMEMSTGVVKITPAHDPNDFEVGQRHNLEQIIVINEDGTMNDNALHYNHMDRFACRQALVKELKDENLLITIKKIVHSVGHSERTDVMVEPYLSRQWFVKMDKLAHQVVENQKTDQKLKFVPSRFEKILNHWMEDCHDWCISRQLWWGHQIPAWYKDGKVHVGMHAPKEEGWIQDQDVLDTWFSSALWPFSTLGWPENTDLLKRYYPNNVLVTGYDIIFFWVCRMVFQGLEFTKTVPFKECIIHGLIRDSKGRKMSKSLGNGVDPMEVIDKYGADALRYYLTTSVANGQDLRYSEEKVASVWNFINKLWNASRFCLMNINDLTKDNYSLSNLKPADKWILTKLNKTIKDTAKYMNKYEFNNVGTKLYSFIWNDFCDLYIEMSKFNLNDMTTKSTLYYTLISIIKLLHPFMPYVTEEIYGILPFKEEQTIMKSIYPIYNRKYDFKKEAQDFELTIDFVRSFRNWKASNNVGSNYKIILKNQEDYSLISKMLKWTEKIIEEKTDAKAYNVANSKFSVDVLYEQEDSELENEKKEKKIAVLTSSIMKRKSLLNNENFVNKAPQELVKQEKEKLKEEEGLLNILIKKED